MKRLVLATGNQGKVSEIEDLLVGLPLEVVTLKEYPHITMPEEDQATFAGNAAKKAETVCRESGELSLADDSGLEVDVLGGRPGVLSARYAGLDGDYEANNLLLLKELQGVPAGRRAARFVCIIAIAVPGERTYFVEGSCAGRIAERPRGDGGFGYDPLFIYEPAGLSFAQMSRAEKNRVSHRGKALSGARKLLEQLL